MANCNVNTHERFADIQMLRYELKGFEALSLNQKLYIYCLAKATLMGRDITFDQQGKYNLRIRKTLEAIYRHYKGISREAIETQRLQAILLLKSNPLLYAMLYLQRRVLLSMLLLYAIPKNSRLSKYI